MSNEATIKKQEEALSENKAAQSENKTNKDNEKLENKQAKKKQDETIALQQTTGQFDVDEAQKKLKDIGAQVNQLNGSLKTAQAGMVGAGKIDTKVDDAGEVDAATAQAQKTLAKMELSNSIYDQALSISGKMLGIADYSKFLSAHEYRAEVSDKALQLEQGFTPAYYDMPDDYNQTKAALMTTAMGIMGSLGDAFGGETGANITEAGGLQSVLADGANHMASEYEKVEQMKAVVSKKNVDLYNQHHKDVVGLAVAYDKAFNEKEKQFQADRVNMVRIAVTNAKNNSDAVANIIKEHTDLVEFISTQNLEANKATSIAQTAVTKEEQSNKRAEYKGKVDVAKANAATKRANAQATNANARSVYNQQVKKIEFNFKVAKALSDQDALVAKGLIGPMTPEESAKRVADVATMLGGDTAFFSKNMRAVEIMPKTQFNRLSSQAIIHSRLLTSRSSQVASDAGTWNTESNASFVNANRMIQFVTSQGVIPSVKAVALFSKEDATKKLVVDFTNSYLEIEDPALKKALDKLGDATTKKPVLYSNVSMELSAIVKKHYTDKYGAGKGKALTPENRRKIESLVNKARYFEKFVVKTIAADSVKLQTAADTAAVAYLIGVNMASAQKFVEDEGAGWVNDDVTELRDESNIPDDVLSLDDLNRKLTK